MASAADRTKLQRRMTLVEELSPSLVLGGSLPPDDFFRSPAMSRATEIQAILRSNDFQHVPKPKYRDSERVLWPRIRETRGSSCT